MTKTVDQLRQEEIRLVRAYRNLFSTPDGIAVLDHMRELFGNRTSIVPGDSYMTHAREGAREVVLHIEQQISLGAKQEDE